MRGVKRPRSSKSVLDARADSTTDPHEWARLERQVARSKASWADRDPVDDRDPADRRPASRRSPPKMVPEPTTAYLGQVDARWTATGRVVGYVNYQSAGNSSSSSSGSGAPPNASAPNLAGTPAPPKQQAERGLIVWTLNRPVTLTTGTNGSTLVGDTRGGDGAGDGKGMERRSLERVIFDPALYDPDDDRDEDAEVEAALDEMAGMSLDSEEGVSAAVEQRLELVRKKFYKKHHKAMNVSQIVEARVALRNIVLAAKAVLQRRADRAHQKLAASSSSAAAPGSVSIGGRRSSGPFQPLMHEDGLPTPVLATPSYLRSLVPATPHVRPPAASVLLSPSRTALSEPAVPVFAPPNVGTRSPLQAGAPLSSLPLPPAPTPRPSGIHLVVTTASLATAPSAASTTMASSLTPHPHSVVSAAEEHTPSGAAPPGFTKPSRRVVGRPQTAASAVAAQHDSQCMPPPPGRPRSVVARTQSLPVGPRIHADVGSCESSKTLSPDGNWMPRLLFE